MRPVERGAAPRIYNNYRNAIKDLVNRLGPYCSYCERRLPTGLSVEHVFPKSLYVDRALDWSNFLLACVNCNSTKGNNDPLDIFLPDRDNTLLVLSYFQGGFVPVAAQMDIQSTRRARGLIDFLGLDRHGATGWPRPASRDNRRRDREKAWNRNNRVRALKLAWNSECLLAGHRQNDRNGDDKLRDGTSSKVPPDLSPPRPEALAPQSSTCPRTRSRNVTIPTGLRWWSTTTAREMPKRVSRRTA